MAALFGLGFAAKLALVELDLGLSTRYVNECLVQRLPATKAAELECYRAPHEHTAYRVISALNGQPAFWKNTPGRCVGTEGSKLDAYYECGWWNRFAI
jgi:hypothetical protein